MPKPTDQQIEGLKDRYGEVYEFTGEGEDGQEYSFLFRKPDRAALSRFAAKGTKDVMKAVNNLVFDCLLYPGAEEVQRLFDRMPGLPIALGAELQKTIGSTMDFFRRPL